MERKKAWRYCLLSCVFFTIPLLNGCESDSPEEIETYELWEHVDRIRTRTEERFAKDFERGKIVNYDVEILFNFKEEPNLFMVELEYDKPYTCFIADGVDYKSQYAHIIGYISHSHNNYYTGLRAYQSTFKGGRSAYAICGYDGEKKYYSNGICAVKVNGQLLQIHNMYANEDYNSYNYEEVEFSDSECFEQKYLTENKYKNWNDGIYGEMHLYCPEY